MPKVPSSPARRKGTATTRKSDPYFSRAVEKALAALELLRQSSQPLSLQQISSAVGLTKASAFRLLYTLENLKYLSKLEDGRYSAPSRGNHAVQSRVLHDMLRVSGEALARLNMEFRETGSLAALFENHIEVLAVVESPQVVRMGNTPGRILPPNASSLGKAIAAFQPAEVTDQLIRSYGTYSFTPRTITDERALREEFAQIRAQGFAEDREESTPGGRCFAAPILRRTGHAIGAVSLSMPLIRYQGEAQRQTVLAAVRQAAATIQRGIASNV